VTDTIAPTRQWIATEHGLVLLPDYDYDTAPGIERLLVPGQDAAQLAQMEAAAWTALHNGVSISYLHADLPGHFAFDAPLLDLARSQDVPTAQMRQRKLEYRPPTLEFSGAGWPWLMTLKPILVGLASVLILWIRTRISTRRGATPVFKRAHA
jgi:hypothetical protein